MEGLTLIQLDCQESEVGGRHNPLYEEAFRSY